MKLIIISGRSGSGKSTALHILEDMGFYCVDNLPVGLLPALAVEVLDGRSVKNSHVAVGIDARNLSKGFQRFPEILRTVEQTELICSVIYLDADDSTLLRRFSETRRKHPLSNAKTSLSEAIAQEKMLLEPIFTLADLIIDTRKLTIHQLRDTIKQRITDKLDQQMAILFESFSYKGGVPLEADIVFDIRCLPNPYWVPQLRSYRGMDAPVVEFLEQQPQVMEMYRDLQLYLEKWLPRFAQDNRSYITIAIGCTGGQHRSVYLAERLAQHFSAKMQNVQVRHRELG